MEDWKNLLKWQYIIPFIMFIFTIYAGYLKLHEQVDDLLIKTNDNANKISYIQDKQNKYEVDIAVIKNNITTINGVENDIKTSQKEILYNLKSINK